MVIDRLTSLEYRKMHKWINIPLCTQRAIKHFLSIWNGFKLNQTYLSAPYPHGW